jgi:hypothetical protein
VTVTAYAVAFAQAQLDDDEAGARACADNDGNLAWRDSPVQASAGDHTIRTSGARPVARIRESDSRAEDDGNVTRILDPHAVAAHIARYDPERALREVEAGRRVLARHRGCASWLPPCPDLRDLLARWAGRPGYDERWGPHGN